MSYDEKPVFLSYSRSDNIAAGVLHRALQQAGLKLFKDDKSIRAGERWLSELEKAVDECAAFVVLVGGEGVRRWVAGEVQVGVVTSGGFPPSVVAPMAMDFVAAGNNALVTAL